MEHYKTECEYRYWQEFKCNNFMCLEECSYYLAHEILSIDKANVF